MQTVKTLIRRRILRHLIWVYTVCLYPFYGTLCLNWFNRQAQKLFLLSIFKINVIKKSVLKASGTEVISSVHLFKKKKV